MELQISSSKYLTSLLLQDAEISKTKIKSDSSSNFHKIPNLVLEKIFTHLNTSDRMSAMDVCRRWDYVVNEMVGITKYVGKQPKHVYRKQVGTLTWDPIEIIETFGVETCTFGEVTESLNSDTRLPLFWNPDIVNMIEFYGEISHPYFMKLTMPLRFLTSLTLHLITFVKVDFGAQHMVKMNMKSLRIVFTHLLEDIDWSFSDLNENALHKSLMSFLETSTFLSIQSLSIDTPYFKNKMGSLYRGIHIFSMRHENSLKDLSFNCPYEWIDKSQSFQSFYPSTSINWGSIQLENIDVIPSPIMFETEDPENDNQINNAQARVNKQSLNKYWTSLLLGLCRLKRLRYYNPDETWDFPMSIFFRNSYSLKSAVLTVSSKCMIDCKAFESCNNLTSLTLHGTRSFTSSNFDEDYDESFPVPRFVNAIKLPASLEDLKISGILISTKELDEVFITGHLSKLKYLSLFQISKNVENCGASLGTVRVLLNTSSILHIHLVLAFNKQNIKQGLEKLSLGLQDDEVTTLKFILALNHQEYKLTSHFNQHPEDMYLKYNRSIVPHIRSIVQFLPGL